jgi:type II secretory pathway pseudopilin PulG
MTLIGWLMVLAIVGFVTLIALRLLPGYMEYLTVRQVVEQVYNQATPESTPATIRGDIQRRFTVNDVKSVSARDIEVTRQENRITIRLAYEYRTPVVGNVDAVLVFDRTYGPN